MISSFASTPTDRAEERQEESPSFEDPEHRQSSPRSRQEHPSVEELRRVLENPKSHAQTIYTSYRAIPSPRAPRLSRLVIRRLLRRLSLAGRRNFLSTAWYLSVMDDVKAAQIPLTTAEWNSAISLVGRRFGRVTPAKLELALQHFRALEADSKARAGQVTFNVLFDLAAKAGNFVLAELVLKEMAARGLELDRFGHVALIYHYGLRADGDGIRAAYRRLVDGGSIVDTVVLNCVIAALLLAGEPSTAQHVYERMKRFHADHSGAPLPPRPDWAVRSLGHALKRLSRAAVGDAERLRLLQEKAMLAPDARTFFMLISYHCHKTGQFDAIVALVEEMRQYEVAFEISIFRAILQGFSIHGGGRRGTWTATKLDHVWAAFSVAVYEGKLYLGPRMVIWYLRASCKCAGKRHMLTKWDEIRASWQGVLQHQARIERAILQLLAARNLGD